MDKQKNLHRSWVRGTCIGKGSFGTVNLAVNTTNGELFAVKSVNQTSCLPAQLHSLNNEIRILRSLSSPYVINYLGDDVTYDESSTTSSYRNLHLGYMPAGTVSDLAKNSGYDVDERIIRAHTWCIVSALKYVHSKGIVHCDVKGKNILLGPTNDTVKLADFGSAFELSGMDINSTRGSPLWMAPEVVRMEYQGPESDVWSLGCTVIEMFTGKPAWEDRGADTLGRIGYSDELPVFPTRISELSRDFLNKCLRREAKERWSCDQLLHHPFISMCSPPSKSSVTHSSPRCVLDWFGSESSDESEPLDEEEIEDCDAVDNLIVNARGRIGKLASDRGANWESDGWTLVRGLDVCCCGERTSLGEILEFSDSIGVSVESGRENLKYLDYNNSSGYNDVVTEWGEDEVAGSSSCQYGIVQSRGEVVGSREKGSCSCNKLLKYYWDYIRRIYAKFVIFYCIAIIIFYICFPCEPHHC